MIHESRETFVGLSVEGLCALLEVSRSGYYLPAPGETESLREAVRLRDAIERSPSTLRVAADRGIVLEYPGYGYRRVTAQLKRESWGESRQAACEVNHKRVMRSLATLRMAVDQGVMHEESLLCQLQRRWVRTTGSEHEFRIYPSEWWGTACRKGSIPGLP